MESSGLLKDRGKEYWNKRAEDFRKDKKEGLYESLFIEKAGIIEGESVLDMGCGSGTLAFPLARRGSTVLACDFSERMLKILDDEARERKLDNRIETRLLDWNEDWEEKNIYSCDVAIASRSLMVKDVDEAIDKISSRAKRKVIVTSPAEEGNKYSAVLAELIGYESQEAPYYRILSALERKGIDYTLDFIDMGNKEVLYSSKEECIRKVTEGFPEGLEDKQREKLVDIIEKNYANGVFDIKWPVKWAFITWETRKNL